MATYANYPPQVVPGSGGNVDFEFAAYPITAGQSYVDGAVVDLVSGSISAVAANPATVAGVSISAANAVFTNVAGQPILSQLFGVGQNLGTPLFPGDQAFGFFVPFHNNQYFEFSLTTALPGTPSQIVGSAVRIDLISGIYVVNTTGGNQIGKVVQLVVQPINTGPGGLATNGYAGGDLGARVIVEVTSGLTI
jgi:hypothetical protein